MNYIIIINLETYQLSLQATPSQISSTADMWSTDTSKAAFLGVTAHWIEVKNDVWVMRSEVIGLQSVDTTYKCACMDAAILVDSLCNFK